MEDEKRKEVAIWLNTLGFDFEFDSDGFWMEDNDFAEHKTKDVIDLILEYNDFKTQI